MDLFKFSMGQLESCSELSTTHYSDKAKSVNYKSYMDDEFWPDYVLDC